MRNAFVALLALLVLSTASLAVECPECGSDSPKGIKSCPECGAKLPGLESPPSGAGLSPTTAPSPRTATTAPVRARGYRRPGRKPARKPPAAKPRDEIPGTPAHSNPPAREPRPSRSGSPPATPPAPPSPPKSIFDPHEREDQRAALTFGRPASEAIDRRIKRAAKSLLGKQLADGSWGAHGNPGKWDQKTGKRATNPNYHVTGPTAMAVYALIESGVSPQDARLLKALKWLMAQKEDRTYSLALRANAYLAAWKTGCKEYRAPLEKDARTLYRRSNRGGYTYIVAQEPGGRPYDNSNSQYGLLGVWAARQAGLEVPLAYWQQVTGHWKYTQNIDGGWPYKKNADRANARRTRATMVAAGLASLFVCYDQLYADRFIKCGAARIEYRPIERGLKWMDENFAASLAKPAHLMYYLYGLERVGLACGYKYFGGVDWYKLGAEKILNEAGAWGGWSGIPNTCFGMLFLVRGRHPVLFNRLKYDGDWNNRPRALAALTRWMSSTFERTVNWQIVSLDAPIHDWHDAPILFISGSVQPKFTDAQIAKLRSFVGQGGVIFSMTECKGKPFRDGIRQVYRKMFPKYELTAAGKDHEIYSRKVCFDLPPHPQLYTMSNGVRPLVIHTDADLAADWQTRKYASRKRSFETAANVVRYVVENVALARFRGQSPWPPEEDAAAAKINRTIKLVRLKHGGRYDPEPLAYERLRRILAIKDGIRLQARMMKIADLPAAGVRIATLCGTGTLALTSDERAALAKYLAAGGVLLVEAVGGSEPFASSAAKALRAMYPSERLRPLAARSSVYSAAGRQIRSVTFRRKTHRRLGARTHLPLLRGITIDGRLGVIFSREDITGGLMGCPFYTLDGYRCRSAYALMRNIILYADSLR